MAAAEDVERQVAVGVVVAVEEAALLVAMQGIVGGIQVEHDRLRRALMRLQEQRHEQRLDRLGVVPDLVIAADAAAQGLLEPVQRRLAGERRAVLAARLELADQRRHHRIMAQKIMIVEVLVAERQAEHALADQRHQAVLDQLGRTGVAETGRKAFDEPDRLVGGAEQQRTAIRGDRAAVKGAHNPTTFDGSEIERILPTLCRHRGALLLRPKSFSQKHFR